MSNSNSKARAPSGYVSNDTVASSAHTLHNEWVRFWLCNSLTLAPNLGSYVSYSNLYDLLPRAMRLKFDPNWALLVVSSKCTRVCRTSTDFIKQEMMKQNFKLINYYNTERDDYAVYIFEEFEPLAGKARELLVASVNFHRGFEEVADGIFKKMKQQVHPAYHTEEKEKF